MDLAAAPGRGGPVWGAAPGAVGEPDGRGSGGVSRRAGRRTGWWTVPVGFTLGHRSDALPVLRAVLAPDGQPLRPHLGHRGAGRGRLVALGPVSRVPVPLVRR